MSAPSPSPTDGAAGRALGVPLAEALAVAAAAWEHFLAGQSLPAAIDAACRAAHHPASPSAGQQAAPAGPGPSVAASERLAAAVRELVYSAARQRALAEALIGRLAPRPPAAPLAALLALALAQLRLQRVPAFVVVDQAVAATRRRLDTAAAAGFVNAVLRRYLRERTALDADALADPAVAANLPPWWLERLRAAYPAEWPAIVREQAAAPPLVLRVNRRVGSAAAYVAELNAAGRGAQQVGADAVWLHDPLPVERIPGFREGRVSVQDAGAQFAVDLLAPRAGERVLDACAAPGGKTLHLVERADVAVLALDDDAARAARIADNRARIGAAVPGLCDRVHIRVADVVAWAEALRAGAADARADLDPVVLARGFDAILLDAPCTASGIVRRQPDIPWSRQPADVANSAKLQARMLEALWPLLAPAGRLLYVVCSLFPEEGEQQVARFLARHPEARSGPAAGGSRPGLQLLPASVPPVPGAAPAGRAAANGPSPEQPTVHDGFYFALLTKP